MEDDGDPLWDLSAEELDMVKTLKKSSLITDSLINDLITTAETFFIEGNNLKALQISKSAISASKYLKNTERLIQSLGTYGNILVRMDQLTEALNMYEAAARLCEQDTPHCAILCGSIGNIHINKGNTEKALSYHEKALEICEKNRYSTIQMGALINLGIDYYRMGNYETALVYMEKALKMSDLLGDSKKKADIHSNIGVIALEAGIPQRALHHIKKGYTLHKSFQLLFEQASDAMNIGNIHHERGQLRKALLWYRKSRRLYKKIGSVSGEASTQMNIGTVLMKKGYIKKALTSLESALTSYTLIQNITGVADTCANMGVAYGRLGDMSKAISCHQKAAALFSSLSNKVGEADQVTQLGSILADAGDYEGALQYYNRSLDIYQILHYPKGEASTYTNLGLTEYYRGGFTEAIEYFLRAMSIYEELNNPEGIGRSCGNIAHVFYSAGEHEKALQWYEKALKIYSKEKFQKQMADAFINMGNVYYSKDKKGEALEVYEKALHVSLRIGYRKGEIDSYVNMGVVCYEDTGKALNFFEKALNRCQEGNFPLVEASIYLNVGLIHLRIGNADKALKFYDKSLKISEKNGYCELEQKAYTNLGRLYDLKGNFDEAFQYYERAVRCSDVMRDRIDTPEMETRIIGKEDIYEMIVMLALKMGDMRKAFKYIEKAKSRTLVKLLRKHEVLQRDDPLLRGAQALEHEIDYMYYQMMRQGAVTPQDILEKRQSLTELQKIIAHKYSDYGELCLGISTELEEIQKVGAQILEYFIVKDEVLALLISGSHVEYEFLSIPPVCRKVISSQRPAFLKVTSLQEILYRMLVQPFEEHLDDTPLCIIPHGFIHHFPFGALFDGDTYLVEKYRICYAPSSTVLKICLEKESKRRKEYLVMGYSQNRKYERSETDSIAEILGTRPLDPLMDVFLRECSHMDVIHLASHGAFLEDDPLNSYVELQDGRLNAKNVFNLHLKADLVVLSACESGVNEVAGGDDLMGLERAFLSAGAQSMVHSLWPVYGVSTTEVMVQVYENLMNGQSKLDSLRNAQVEMLHSNRFNNPFYWASFVLVGDWH